MLELNGLIYVKCHYTIQYIHLLVRDVLFSFPFNIVSKILPCCYCCYISFVCGVNILLCECMNVPLFNPFSCQCTELPAVLSGSNHCPEAHEKELHWDGTAGPRSMYLALQDNPSMFHKVIVPFTCLLEYSVQHLILLDFLVFASFKNVQYYFIVVLICISLTINEDGHLLMYFLAIYLFSFVRCLFTSNAYFF